MTATMVAVPLTETAQMRRLSEFAADVAQLANERRIDLELRDLVDGVHADLLALRAEADE